MTCLGCVFFGLCLVWKVSIGQKSCQGFVSCWLVSRFVVKTCLLETAFYVEKRFEQTVSLNRACLVLASTHVNESFAWAKSDK